VTATEVAPPINAHDTLIVDRWFTDERGEPVTSVYAELFWLPVAGPTSLWLLRRLNAYLADATTPRLLDVAELGRELGLFPPRKPQPTMLGRHNPVARAVDRLSYFGLVRRTPDNGMFRVRTLVPALSPARVAQLPTRLQHLHADWVATR
jgi:hypothetical protein